MDSLDQDIERVQSALHGEDEMRAYCEQSGFPGLADLLIAEEVLDLDTMCDLDPEDIIALAKGSLSLGQKSKVKKGCSSGHVQLWRDEQAEKAAAEHCDCPPCDGDPEGPPDPLCGLYRTLELVHVGQTVELGPYTGQDFGSGSLVEVVEIATIPGRIRGRLAGGGWISLLNTGSQHRWALPMPKPGRYRTVPKVVSVSERCSRDSAHIKDLTYDVELNIVEVALVPGRVRGRIESGGWISILNTESGNYCGHCWAVPIMGPGPYRVREEADMALNETSDRNSSSRGKVRMNEMMFVEETRMVGDRVRGRLQRGGWVSLIQTVEDPGTKAPHTCKPTGGWTRRLPDPGLYYCTKNAVVTSGPSKDDSHVESVKEGEVMFFSEIRFLGGERRIRGYCPDRNGWVSIVNTSNDTGWCKTVGDDGFWSTDRR